MECHHKNRPRNLRGMAVSFYNGWMSRAAHAHRRAASARYDEMLGRAARGDGRLPAKALSAAFKPRELELALTPANRPGVPLSARVSSQYGDPRVS